MASVADDGVGFDPAAPSQGVGLLGMRERAQLLGATLEVCSSPSGTTVRLGLAHVECPPGAAGTTPGRQLSRAGPGPGPTG